MNHQQSSLLNGPLRPAMFAELHASVLGPFGTETADQAHGGATPLAPLPENEQGRAQRQAGLRSLAPEKLAQARAKAKVSREQQRQQWATLDLRQDWADEAWMLEHLKAAGVRVASRQEPATVARMRAKLRSITQPGRASKGVLSPQVVEAIGMPLGRYLQKNPRLPLWAALALVLEAMGSYTQGPAPRGKAAVTAARG